MQQYSFSTHERLLLSKKTVEYRNGDDIEMDMKMRMLFSTVDKKIVAHILFTTDNTVDISYGTEHAFHANMAMHVHTFSQTAIVLLVEQ